MRLKLWLTHAARRVSGIATMFARVGSKSLTILARWLGLIFLIVALIGIPLGLVIAFVQLGEFERRSVFPTIGLALAILMAEIGILTLYIAIRLVSRFISSTALFGRSGAGIRVTALLISLMFFRTIPAQIARFLSTATVSLVFSIPFSIIREAIFLSPLRGAKQNDPEAAGQFITLIFQRTLGDLSFLGIMLNQTLDFGAVVLFAIVWVLIARTLHELREADSGRRLRAFIEAHPALNWLNLGFFLLLVGSLFLSLAAISSLPRLRERYNPNSEVSPETLRSTLERLQTSKEQLARYLITEAVQQPVSELSGTAAVDPSTPPPKLSDAKTASKAIPQSGTAEKPSDSPTLKRPAPTRRAPIGLAAESSPNQRDPDFSGVVGKMLDAQRKELDGQMATLNELRLTQIEGFLVSQAQARDNAVNQFRIENLDRRGSHEEVEHFLRIHSWFVDQVRSQGEGFADCARRIREFRAETRKWIEASNALLVMTTELVKAGGSSMALVPPAPPALPNLAYSEAERVCSVQQWNPIPNRPPLGESLGVLKYGAAWLLNAGSVPLAAIIGMIGFGLLGSVISTFVRERVASSKSGDDGVSAVAIPHVLVSDLAGVVLRGLSAAIVVFLAVQGGLAVFAGGQSDPNPYVLLLTCLVAAVFSEKVWARANEYLAEKLEGREQPKGTSGSSPGATGDSVSTEMTSVPPAEERESRGKG